MKAKFIIVIMGYLLFLQCDKDGTDTPPELSYNIIIHSPDLDAKHVGDQIHIHVDFDEINSQTVHHVNIQILNKDSAEVIYDMPFVAHVHETSGHYEWHDDFILNVSAHSDWILKAKVWGHEAGVAERVEDIEFHVHPK